MTGNTPFSLLRPAALCGAVLVVLLVMTGLAVGLTGVRVHAVTHPTRQASAEIDFDYVGYTNDNLDKLEEAYDDVSRAR